MYFSIIIINYNTKELTKNCLDSIFLNCNEDDFEIIVVDNNSSDGSAEMLEKKLSNRVRIIKNQENIGFGPANNQGAEIAKGKYLFFLNSDTIIKNNILKPLKDIFKSDEEIGVVSPKLVLEDGEVQERAYGKFPNLLSIILEKFKKPPRIKEKLFEVDWVSGAAMIIRRDVFKKINDFDEKFFMYFEDVDLCKRVKNLGYKVCFYPKISIIHLGGQSIKKNLKRKKYYYKSQDYFYKKHYGHFKMCLMKIIRWPYKLVKLL